MEKHMTLRLDDNLADMIKIMAKRERSSASELVRKAIQTYFNRSHINPEGSSPGRGPGGYIN